jgi:hypothetical protein
VPCRADAADQMRAAPHRPHAGRGAAHRNTEANARISDMRRSEIEIAALKLYGLHFLTISLSRSGDLCLRMTPEQVVVSVHHHQRVTPASSLFRSFRHADQGLLACGHKRPFRALDSRHFKLADGEGSS